MSRFFEEGLVALDWTIHLIVWKENIWNVERYIHVTLSMTCSPSLTRWHSIDSYSAQAEGSDVF
jgi:hypothetical protein